MSQKNNGYRLGLLARQKMREHGVEDSPLMKFGLNIGLGLASVVALGLETAGEKGRNRAYKKEEPLNGYHETGPEGPGYYFDGTRLTD